jgi:ribose 5-phosphate isomerase RpiB
MYTPEDKASLTYVMNGLLAGILLNAGAYDSWSRVAHGMGSMLAATPCRGCSAVIDPTDAFLFGQINDGNAISMPYAKGFGWAGRAEPAGRYRK